MIAEAERLLKPHAEILDVCCGGRMWWWNKNHPLAVYMDQRELEKGDFPTRPNFEVAPDVVANFRDLPFADESFQLVLFDPPHIVRENPGESFIRLRYGELHPLEEQIILRAGFEECWRVLAPGGTLVFKWADKLERVEPHFPATPIVGTRTPRGGQTRWFIFYKPLAASLSEGALTDEGARTSSGRVNGDGREGVLPPAPALSDERAQ